MGTLARGRAVVVLSLFVVLGLRSPRPSEAAATVAPDGRAAVVTALSGTAVVRPVGRERKTLVRMGTLLFPGDVLVVDARGANALEARLVDGARVVAGPGSILELADVGGVRLLHGDVEIRPVSGQPTHVIANGGFAADATATTWLRVDDVGTKTLLAEPTWLTGYRASLSEEWMGSLLATVHGTSVPLSIGFHKVSVEIQDQIARTTIEESFVNETDEVLEGVFSFPLPAEASISGFGLWIGGQLVEADVVERTRAREIYEDILRRKKDPGLLEWEGGNVFKARVYPIPKHGERRVRLRYTEVLPLEGEGYRYRYALRSELLRQHPLRDLSIGLTISSTNPIAEVTSPTHPVVVRATAHEAVVEYEAHDAVPERDFEAFVRVGAAPPVAAVAHRRGDDGYFLLLVRPPPPPSGPTGTDVRGVRDLVPDGKPLDLVLVADTSGSMDDAARRAEAAFIAALLAGLSEKDRFRLVALDVALRELGGAFAPATADHVKTALDQLAARRSLGWTDLERTFDDVLGHVAAGTHVIYVGDGIPSAGAPDVVATADRIRAKGASSGAICHAVSISAAYEARVLTAIASIGGGSVRRAERPAEAAGALLREIAHPGAKNLKAEVRGIATAEVYPAVMANLPVGEQGVVLGRYLPSDGPVEAQVVVTGTFEGKPISYATSLTLPAPEGGNSFLPRLWARRRLDHLLARRADAATREEIIDLSRAHQIITPYTSFLVLESDEDRAFYGVERVVRMRDGERYFASAHDRAALEITRRQAVLAATWKSDLRRAVGQEIETLGRNLPIPGAERTASGFGAGGFGLTEFADLDEDGNFTDRPPPFLGAGGAAPSGLVGGIFARPAATGEGWAPMRRWWPRERNSLLAAENSDLRSRGECAADFFNRSMCCASQACARPAAAPEASVAFSDASAGVSLDMSTTEATDDDASSGDPAVRQPSGFRYGVAYNSVPFLLSRIERTTVTDASLLGFPTVPTAMPARPSAFEPAWDPIVLEALRSLDRRSSFAAPGSLFRIASTVERLHALRGTVEARRRESVIASDRRWYAATEDSIGAALESWCNEVEVGVLDPVTRLGRVRPATDADRAACPIPVIDRSVDDQVSLLSSTFHRRPRFNRDGDVVRIVFPSDADPEVELQLTIDRRRGVLLDERLIENGAVRQLLRFADFVEIGGRAWATRAETRDAADRVIERRSIRVEELAPDAFRAAYAAASSERAEAILLGAGDRDVAASRLAIKAGRGGLPEHLALVLDRLAASRPDAALDAWREIERLPLAARAMAWLRVEFFVRVTRPVEFAEAARAFAGSIGVLRSARDVARFHRLDAMTGALGAAQQLELLEAFLAAGAVTGPDSESLETGLASRHAAALEAAGQRSRARALRAELAASHPSDPVLILARAADLAAGDDRGACATYLVERARHGGPFLADELATLFAEAVHWRWSLRDLAGVEEAAGAWAAALPSDPSAEVARISALYLRQRDAEADRLVLERLTKADVEGSDPVAFAALTAAVRIALATNSDYGSSVIERAWRGPLADLAARLAHSTASGARLAETILSDGRFQATSEGALVERALREELTAPGAIATMPIRKLRLEVRNRVGYLDAEERGRVADGIVARWRTSEDPVDASLLAELADGVFRAGPAWRPNVGAVDDPGAGPHSVVVPRIEFLRERLARAKDREANRLAGTLFDALMSEPHDEPREVELFALLPRLVDPTDDRETNAGRLAGAARRLASVVRDARVAAEVAKPIEGPPPTRAAWARTQREAVRRGVEAAVARLAAAVVTADPLAKPWLELERLGYATEGAGALTDIVDGAERLLEDVGAGAAPIDRVFRRRIAAVLVRVAARSDAPAALVDRVLADIRARLAQDPSSIDERLDLVRVLVATDRVEALLAETKAWSEATDPDSRWTLLRAYVEANAGRLDAAITTMESVAASGDLVSADWDTIAEWQVIRGNEAGRVRALEGAALASSAESLRYALEAEIGRLRGRGAPEALDPEVFRALRAIASKGAGSWMAPRFAREVYDLTHDFRALQGLVDAVVGLSPENAYQALANADTEIAQIGEEAPLDALGARIDERLAAATTDMDRRALRLLLAAVELRAAAVAKADPRHAARALMALRAAREGPIASVERLRLARHVSTLSVPANSTVAGWRRQLLEDLGEASEDPLERLALGQLLANLLWAHDEKDEALSRLGTLLGALRDAYGGTLVPDAESSYEAYVAWSMSRGRWRDVVASIQADLGREPRPERRDRLRRRLYDVYVKAVGAGANTSLGTQNDVFRAAATEMERELAVGPGYLYGDVAKFHAALHVAAKREREYERFLRERLPAILDRDPATATSFLGAVFEPGKIEISAMEGLRAALDRADREPPWIVRQGLGVWPRLDARVAEWRRAAGDVGDLAPRLRTHVVASLEAQLEFGGWQGSSLATGTGPQFWEAERPAFAAAAREVAGCRRADPDVALRVARYQRDRLGASGDAISTLEAARAPATVSVDLRATLRDWLMEALRFAEALPIAERLVADRPRELLDRLALARVLYGVGRDGDAGSTLDEAARRLAEEGADSSSNVEQIADVALDIGDARRSLGFIEGAIRRADGLRAGGTSGLEGFGLRTLGRAKAALGDTDGAVRALAARAVVRGFGDGARSRAVDELLAALREAPDLDGWLTRYDASVRASGTDAPLLRGAAGRILLERGESRRAAEQLRLAVGLEPTDAEHHGFLIRALDGVGDVPALLDALIAAQGMARGALGDVPDLAEVYRKSGDDDSAERARTDLVERSPRDPIGHVALARIREASGLWSAAIEQWTVVTRERPLDPEGWMSLAGAELKSGHPAAARATIATMLRTVANPADGALTARVAAFLAGIR